MAKTIKYPFPQEPRKTMQEVEKISFMQRVLKVYKIMFWMYIPFIVTLLPVIPAVLFNEWYALFMIITFPVGVVLFDFVTEKIFTIL